MLSGLDNLKPAPKIEGLSFSRPGVQFDETTGLGEATTKGLIDEPHFDEFLRNAGYDPDVYEVVGNTVRTSKWQQREDGDWLTAYRFTFRLKTAVIDLPLLYAEAKKQVRIRPLKALGTSALVILWSDLQIGKVDHRGGTPALLERVELMKARLVALIREKKPNRIVFCDVGDTIENFSNKASLQQLRTNDLSLMEMVDLATTLAWDVLKTLAALVPDITYASIGSNHCGWRVNGQSVGKPTDDWGVHIGRTLARLAGEMKLPIRFIEPQPHDESLAHDVFGDGYHILGLVHGHQAGRPDGVPDWWRKQAFGRQPVEAATILASGHFHHLRVQELGSTQRGGSRFWVQAATLDNGSSWWKLNSGEDSVPGLVCFVLDEGVDFTGSVVKL